MRKMAKKPPPKGPRKGPPPSLQETLTAARVAAKPLGVKGKQPQPNAPTGRGPARAGGMKKVTGLEKRVPWDAGKLQAFVEGKLTLAELEGISLEEQFEMATSGHTFLQNDKLADAEKVFLGLTLLNPKQPYFQ